jgi:hypothetical protein
MDIALQLHKYTLFVVVSNLALLSTVVESVGKLKPANRG